MKKILLVVMCLGMWIGGYAQMSVIISGETNPSPNQTYTYNINQFIGISGTKATWTVKNGNFLLGGTTITQDVDIPSVGVRWNNKPGESGTLSYSYKNGSSHYQGSISVNIKGSTGGGSGGVGDQKFGEIEGPVTAKIGDVLHYKIRTDYFRDFIRTEWTLTDLYKILEIIESTNDYIKVKVLTYGSALIDFKSHYSQSAIAWGMKSLIVRPEITAPKFVCMSETFTCSLPERDDVIINWEPISNIVLVSGQGSHIATFKASSKLGAKYGQVRATITYDGINYATESDQIWIGAPGSFASGQTFYSTASIGDTKTFSGVDGGEYYSWSSFPSYMEAVSNGKDARVRFLREGVYNFSCTATNPCGTNILNFEVTVGGLSINPPGGGIINQSLKSTDPSDPVTVQIYSFTTGSLVYSKKNVMNFDIKNTTLKDDIYIVVTTDKNGESKSQKIMKTSR